MRTPMRKYGKLLYLASPSIWRLRDESSLFPCGRGFEMESQIRSSLARFPLRNDFGPNAIHVWPYVP
jgi:hypothetical protein